MTDLSGNLNILPTLVPGGCGLASFSCILYSLRLILVTEDGRAARGQRRSVCQPPCEERSAMLRRVVGFK
ncbi:hypothetical protein PBY51_022202 [Eleginops maclovinus]|uniref:Uncharacterized protein n=1 Tax=Eleginops maclovinus TaxID=56733 RepID=A0AAN8AMT1_ELEMC|nr:hypothetical protein PBY51_022202 [Eleginops maclovinus]